MVKRCEWACGNELEKQYHDTEWGKPIYDDTLLFEFLILEGAQAGLSWSTILTKRENYRTAFDHFNAEIISHYDQKKIDSLLADTGIIRNKLKIHSVISNAKAFLAVRAEHNTFSDFIWDFVDHQPIQNSWEHFADIPTQTDISNKMSVALKKRGFKFVGPTICYAFMQAVGMVNDHTTDCFKYSEI